MNSPELGFKLRIMSSVADFDIRQSLKLGIHYDGSVLSYNLRELNNLECRIEPGPTLRKRSHAR